MNWPAFLLLSFGALGQGHSAWAWVPTAVEARLLSRGQMILDVKPDKDGASGLIQAGIDIDAPASVVWHILVDCDLAPRMVPNLSSCRILERDPLGRFDVREHISKSLFFLPSIRNVFRSDYYPPDGIRIRRAGGDMKVLEGEWSLVSQNNGARTRALYQGRATAPFSVPGPISRLVLRDQIGGGLIALRREAQTVSTQP